MVYPFCILLRIIKEEGDYIVKLLFVSVDDREEELLNKIVNIIDNYENMRYSFVEKRPLFLSYEDLEIDVVKKTVRKKSKEIKFTFLEFEMLCLLARNPGRVFKKDEIYDYIWKEPYLGDSDIVMSHIHNIRKKIEDNPSKPIYIETVWGVGYRFNKNLSSDL